MNTSVGEIDIIGYKEVEEKILTIREQNVLLDRDRRSWEELGLRPLDEGAALFLTMVSREGLEPSTPGLKVRCSTG